MFRWLRTALKLQLVKNFAARLLSDKRNFDHISPTLRKLKPAACVGHPVYEGRCPNVQMRKRPSAVLLNGYGPKEIRHSQLQHSPEP